MHENNIHNFKLILISNRKSLKMLHSEIFYYGKHETCESYNSNISLLNVILVCFIGNVAYLRWKTEIFKLLWLKWVIFSDENEWNAVLTKYKEMKKYFDYLSFLLHTKKILKKIHAWLENIFR